MNASLSYTLAANVENLTLTGRGDQRHRQRAGQHPRGNAGNNILDGGAGADAHERRAGNDTYVVDNVGDTVTGTAGRGHRHRPVARSATRWRPMSRT